jgi:hypothetical protein
MSKDVGSPLPEEDLQQLIAPIGQAGIRQEHGNALHNGVPPVSIHFLKTLPVPEGELAVMDRRGQMGKQ